MSNEVSGQVFGVIGIREGSLCDEMISLVWEGKCVAILATQCAGVLLIEGVESVVVSPVIRLSMMSSAEAGEGQFVEGAWKCASGDS